VQREQTIQQLQQQFDVLIIGGGITGVGAARDAAHRNLKTALVEMEDLAFGTSSRSSKLVHGGLRYLENLEFSLVFEAVSERRVLMNIAPHLVLPLGFLFPVYNKSRRGVFTINLGMWVYDALSLFRSPKLHRNLSVQQVQEEEPKLSTKGLKGAPLYYDCSTDDARLTLETALDAEKHGAIIGTYIKVLSYLRDENKKVIGVRAIDRLTQKEIDIKSSVVINATGPWSDRTRNLESATPKTTLRPTKGIHIVVKSERLKTENAVVCFHPEDGRVLFAIPWGTHTYIGTTDTDYVDDPSNVSASQDDVTYLLEASNYYFPTANLQPNDVISTWAGVRPLVCESAVDGLESSVSREHSIRVDSDGLISIAGGKLTTYRLMGQEVVEKAIDCLQKNSSTSDISKAHKKPKTDIIPLPGAVDWPQDNNTDSLLQEMIKVAGQSLHRDSAELIVSIYGTRALEIAQLIANNPTLGQKLIANRPEVFAQIDFAVQSELALSLRDFMIRRTQLFFRDDNQGLDCCTAVGERMKTILDWSPERLQKEIQLYQEEVQRSRQWQKR
jgi:glycerol-3-phosphate dehydrogenase